MCACFGGTKKCNTDDLKCMVNFYSYKVLNKFIQLDIFIVSVRFFPEGFGVT